MQFEQTGFEGLWLIKPKVFEDSRGYFFESFHLQRFAEATGETPDFVQDNQSRSAYGVLRGLHFQIGEHAQAKLVRVLSGSVLDVVVDIRPESPTFGKTYAVELSAQNRFQLYIPRGFAHGFAVLSPTAEFFYKCDNYYAPAFERGIIYNDPDLRIDWQIPTAQLLVSEKDQKLPTLKAFFNHK